MMSDSPGSSGEAIQPIPFIANFFGDQSLRICKRAGRTCEGYDKPKMMIFKIFDDNRFESEKQAHAFDSCVQQANICSTGHGQHSSLLFGSRFSPQFSYCFPAIRVS